MPPHPFAALLMLREFALFLEAERLSNLPVTESEVSANTTDTPSTPVVAAGNWAIPTAGLNGFAQATLEESGAHYLTANGSVNGPILWLSAALDGTALPGVAFSTNGTTGVVSWSAPLVAGLGNHSLVVSAGHPSGNFTASGTSNFTIATAQNITNTHDGGGYVTERQWAGGSTDNLTYDAAGRLLKVSRRDNLNDGFDEQSIYDPLGRRIRVIYTPYNHNTAATTYATTSWDTPAQPGQSETTDSWFDPQVEFLEVATKQGSGGVLWKVYGPDTNGAYGGLQGVGGLQAVLDGTNGLASGMWDDSQGHVFAYGTPAAYNGTVGAVNWSLRSSGYGVLPGQTATRWTGGTIAGLVAALNWQGRRIDASGYYCIGAREYNPVGGRFLSPDPLGHSASWDLYSYAGGDPINHIDCTGRGAAGIQQLQTAMPSGINTSGGTLLDQNSNSGYNTPSIPPGAGALTLTTDSTLDLGWQPPDLLQPTRVTYYDPPGWNATVWGFQAVGLGLQTIFAPETLPGDLTAEGGGEVAADVVMDGALPEGDALTQIGYHATNPSRVDSILTNGLYDSSAGRLGGGGVYVNNTSDGAIAEYWEHNPTGPAPSVLQVQYNPGLNYVINPPPTVYTTGALPLAGDTLTTESLRLPGTLNTLIRNGSATVVPPSP